ncbi:unnamed protein product [Lactuca saligna]|uniref:CS domain-containing protein n=1 Tax=Lactuca saligna TaxID=75948 RepID=A0AA35ZKF8_LACSI|nr:unnamed protein product [Lactuca saligna]
MRESRHLSILSSYSVGSPFRRFLWSVALSLTLSYKFCSFSSQSRHPEIKWAQREDKVYITILLADTKDAKVNLAPEGVFTLSASAGQHEYDLKLELYDKVNVELVEHVATCLIKIAERVQESSEMLDEHSKHGLIHQVEYHIDLINHTTLSYSVHTGLIGLLVKLAFGSMVAVKTLFDLNISSILKEILSIYDLSHGVPSPRTIDGHYNQMHEVLKLLIQLLPVVSRNQEVPLAAKKEAFLVTHPDLVEKFWNDLLHVLIQVGYHLSIMLYWFLANFYNFLDIPFLFFSFLNRFLAGVFTRKDIRVLMLTLNISDNILKKNSEVFMGPFVKEGVLFAINALIDPEKCSRFMFSMFNDIQLSNTSSKKYAGKDVIHCLCFSFDDRLSRATNWVKFSATAGLDVIYGGHLQQGKSQRAPYLPQSGAGGGGGGGSPYSERAALYALGLIHYSKEELFYALEMVNLFDLKKVYFDSRVIALTDCPKKHHKTLDVVLVQETVVLILDDTERGKMDKENLILMERYHFFASSCKELRCRAVGISKGLLMVGTASEKATEMLVYAHETQHEKIIRGLALQITFTVYGREEEADTLIEQMTRDQDPILRYGGMYSGTTNNKGIRLDCAAYGQEIGCIVPSEVPLCIVLEHKAAVSSLKTPENSP